MNFIDKTEQKRFTLCHHSASHEIAYTIIHGPAALLLLRTLPEQHRLFR
jgi:hypothetical protein